MSIAYFAGNRWTGTEDDRNNNVNTSNITAGLTFLETDTDDLYQWDGDSWNLIAGNTAAEILSNKTLTTPQINDTSSDHQYVFAVSELTNDRTVTLPLLGANDTFTFNNHIATFQNKTIVHGADGNSVTGIVNASIANNAAIANSKLAGPSIAVTDGSTSSNIAPGDTLTFTAIANETTVAQSGGTVTIGLPNDVVISGNLTVNGTTTTVSTTNMVVEDSLIELNNGASSNTNDAGLVIERGSTGDNAIFVWDESADKFVAGTTTATGASTGNLSITTGTLVANIEGTLTGNVTGDVSGDAGGNAATVTNGVYTVGNQTIGGTKTFSATIAGSINGNAATVTNGVYLSGAQTLEDKTLTAPKFADLGFIADDQGNELIILDKTSNSAVNEITIANGATGVPASITASGETNIGLKLSGKGTEGVILANATANGAFLEFATKVTDAAKPDDCGADEARMYLKHVDTNNNAIEVKIKKAGAIQKVQITSPKAVCGECGSKDGASDPTYDFARGIMILDLWCGHSYEVPMDGSYINGNS